jgi:uncharacterized membrane protein YqgA involved in biofilm formation
MTGTLINALAVVIGSVLGILVGHRLAAQTQETVLSGLGLMTFVVGIGMALESQNVLIPMFSVLLGGILGEWWGIEHRLETAGRWLEEHVGHRLGDEQEGRVVRAFVTASLVFCVGPLSILGPIQDGLTGDYSLLAIKSLLDGFASLAFAVTLGPGVILSVLTILVYQGSISLLSMGLGTALGEVTRETAWVIEMTAAGGVLIMGIGLVLLNVKRVRVGNLLPAVAIAPLFVVLLTALGISL